MNLAHAKAQAADILAARLEAKRRGRGHWGPWLEKAGLEERQARRYVEFGKAVVTSGFSTLSEDEQWAAWQRIQGNVMREEIEEETEEEPEESEEPDMSALGNY